MAKKRKEVKAGPVKPLRGLEIQYQRQLMKLGRAMATAVKIELLPKLKKEQFQYTTTENLTEKEQDLKKKMRPWEVLEEQTKIFQKDGLALELQSIFLQLNSRFNGVATLGFAQKSASEAVIKTEKANKKRFDKAIHRVTGIDPGAILSAEGLQEFTEININNNINLIKSLPNEYLKTVETIVNQGVTSGARYSTIEKQITAKLGSANSKLVNRIKLIATDQIQTINAQLSTRRSEKLGIKEGYFRTSEDERVRPCHAELNGVRYELAKGAWSKTCKKFIQPGITDIRCRCSYSPIIDLGGQEEKPKELKKVKPLKVAEPKKELSPAEKFKERESLLKRLKEKGVSEEEKTKQLNKLLEKQGLKPVEPKKEIKPVPKKKVKSIKKEKAEPVKKSEAEPLLTKTQIRKKFKKLETKSKRELEKVFKEKKDVLPEAILDYVQAFEINPALRTGKTSRLSGQHKKAIKNLDKILDKKELKEGIQLNRGLTFKTREEFDKLVDSMSVGTIHEDKAYISTTIGDIPKEFLSKSTRPFSVKFKILADKDTKGVYIPNFKTGGIEGNEEAFVDFIDDEKEFLLPRGTKMQIVEAPKTTKGGEATIIMRIVNA